MITTGWEYEKVSVDEIHVNRRITYFLSVLI